MRILVGMYFFDFIDIIMLYECTYCSYIETYVKLDFRKGLWILGRTHNEIPDLLK